MSDNTIPPKPGFMSVASTVLHPSALSPTDFCDWYENTHIQEVQATGGIAGTQRYESLAFTSKYRNPSSSSSASVRENQNFPYDFLTLYRMPDLSFRTSQAFRSLGGQSQPSSDILESIFKQAEFSTRFCEEVDAARLYETPTADLSSPTSSSPPFAPAAPYLLTVSTPKSTSDQAGGSAGSFGDLAGLPGCRRVRRFEVREASVLREFEREYVKEGMGMGEFAVAEFDTEPEWMDVDAAELEIGFWKLRRDYTGSEREPAPWKAG